MSVASSDEETGNEHIFYRDRPEWKDIQPIPQDEDESVVSIDYSPEFIDVFDYFRAVVTKGEKSERALALTEDAIKLNPANYSVWHFRREILKELNKVGESELEFSRSVILRQPKNYQVWQHRKILVEWLNHPQDEANMTRDALQEDSKNYHAWQHRQWLVKRFSLYDSELEFVEEHLETDVRNNSAWNHRYFIINHTTGFTEEALEREIKFTLDRIKMATENESSWNYLRGLVFHSSEGLSGNKSVTSFCEELYNSGNRSPFLLSFIVDMCKEKISQGIIINEYSMERGKAICEELASKIDPIRCNYWKYISQGLDSVKKTGDTN